jgi:hypothetical protein
MKKNLVYLALLATMLVMISGCTLGTGVQINTPVPGVQSGTPAPDGQIVVPGFKLQINAPGQNPLVNKPDANGHVAGFLIGVWHGIISPVTMVVSFVSPSVQMYEVHNDRSQYDFGFLLGVAIIFLVLGVSFGRRRRRL